MHIEIRELLSKDLDELVIIEKECFSVPWSKQSFINELKNPTAFYICALVDEKIAGYMGLWKITDEGHITNVAIRSDYRRLKIGSQLVEKILDVCEKIEIKALTLEVRESNEAAIKLYEKYGFVAEGKRPNYYQRPFEDAIIMWKR